MFQLFIAVGVILLLVLVLVLRLGGLVRVTKGDKDRPDSKSNYVNSVLMLLFLIIGGGLA